MKMVTLIGDCQSTRILQQWSPQCPVEFKAWGNAGQKAWTFHPEEIMDIESTTIEEVPRYLGLVQNYMEDSIKESFKFKFSDIKDEGIIFLWLGYVDIKVTLPEFKNTEKCVLKYLDQIKKYFKNSKVVLVEPFPQFIPYIGVKSEKHPEYSFEERKTFNDEFIYYLNKYGREMGFTNFITQEEIFKCVGFGQKDMLKNKGKVPRGGSLVDSFKNKDMKKIYKLFIDRALKI